MVRAELPEKVGRGSAASIPAVLLARLALDAAFYGDELGGELLWDALTRARAASDIAAALLVVVDVISPQAVALYQHQGFALIPDNRYSLVHRISDTEALGPPARMSALRCADPGNRPTEPPALE